MVSGSGICAKRVVIHAKHHMLGRLTSIIAKELYKQSESYCCSMLRNLFIRVRRKMNYLCPLRKRMNTKPSHGPIHFRAPSKILWRTICGMIPHETKRGAVALARLKVFEGVSIPYYDMIRELEKKRRDRSRATYEKKQLTKLRVHTEKIVDEKMGAQLNVIALIKY